MCTSEHKQQPPTFHMESVCLCGQSLGSVTWLKLCVSSVVCVFEGEDDWRLTEGC